jgi:hypothetical protein
MIKGLGLVIFNPVFAVKNEQYFDNFIDIDYLNNTMIKTF